MLGIVPKRMLSGLISEPMNPSHSSVTTKVMSTSSLLEASNLQKFIMGLRWPLAGSGMATTWGLDRPMLSEGMFPGLVMQSVIILLKRAYIMEH